MRKEVLLPATSNSPDFGSCPCPLCLPAVWGTFPGGGGCKRKASWTDQWFCTSLIGDVLRCGSGLWSGHPCGTAQPPAQSTEAKSPLLQDGCSATGYSNCRWPVLWSCLWRECHCPGPSSRHLCPLLAPSPCSPEHCWGRHHRILCFAAAERDGRCPTYPSFFVVKVKGCDGPSHRLHLCRTVWEGCNPDHTPDRKVLLADRGKCKSGQIPPARPGSRCDLSCSEYFSACALNGSSTCTGRFTQINTRLCFFKNKNILF